MPVETNVSAILAKLGNSLDAAVAKHAKDDTTYGIQPLPPGINNGIARVKSCGFGEYKAGPNAGKPFFRMAGIIVHPKDVIHNGINVVVVGQQTSVMEKLFETKDANGNVVSRDDHMAIIMNYIRRLAGKTATANCKTLGDLEALCKRIEANGLNGTKPIHVRFTTSLKKGGEYVDRVTNVKKTTADGVWENWHGNEGLENWQPPAKKAVTDGTPQVQANGAVSQPPRSPINRLTGAPQAVSEAVAETSSADEFVAAEQQDVEQEDTPDVQDFDAGQEEQGEDVVLPEIDAAATLDDLIGWAVAGQQAQESKGDDDVIDLGAAANNRIREIGAKVGVTSEQLDIAASWEDVKAIIEAAQKPKPKPKPAAKPTAVAPKAVAKPTTKK